MKNPNVKNPLIASLDNITNLEYLDWLVGRLNPYVGMFRIGLEMFVRFGPPALQTIARRDGKILLDIKLNDIPNVMKSAIQSAQLHGAKMITVHASAGTEAIRNSVAALKNSNKIVAVPMLLDPTGKPQSGYGASASQELTRQRLITNAIEAVNAGAHGVVAHPNMINLLRHTSELHKTLLFAVGVRPLWAQRHDLKGVTPDEAMRLGADYLIVGSPLVQADRRPEEAAIEILKEIGYEKAAKPDKAEAVLV